MIKKSFWYAFMLCLLLLGIGVSGQEAENDPIFTLQNDDPIVARGNSQPDSSIPWDQTYTDPGAVTYYDGQFHMIRNGFNGWPASVQMGYLVSDDGITWEQPQEAPILYTDNVPYAEVAALAGDLHVQEDGTWVLYFYTWNTFNPRSAGSTIGRATADDPLGPWIVEDEPVLTFDEDLNETAVFAPSVIEIEDGFAIYYAAYDDRNTLSIRRATSTDGMIWTKDDEPVLIASESWEGISVHQPRVFRVNDENLWMLYRAAGANSRAMRLGLAFSEDGLNWEKYAENPVFTPSDIPDVSQFWFHATSILDDTIYLYIEAGVGSNTDIFTLTATVEQFNIDDE